MSHRFGGPWTEIKLDAVEYYLQCYSKALSAVNLDIWYLDAFAGSGDREAERIVGGLLENFRPVEVVTETLDGSARRALKVEPPFGHFVFIEQNAARFNALERVRADFPNRDIILLNGDANAELCRIAGQAPWRKELRSKSRGVVFLDPYALHVDWETLRALAATRKMDVWYLFPFRDVVRQLAHDIEGIGPKAAMLDRVLGPEWRELYTLPEPSGQVDMFEELDPREPGLQRVPSARAIEGWFRGRLENEFAFVSEPLPILTYQDRHAFSLFLCVSNPARQATDLARHFVQYVNRQHSRRR